MKKEKKDQEETNLKIWIWFAVIDIVAVIVTGVIIFLRP
jgi:cytochrome b subunit of formate dehydrogenase